MLLAHRFACFSFKTIIVLINQNWRVIKISWDRIHIIEINIGLFEIFKLSADVNGDSLGISDRKVEVLKLFPLTKEAWRFAILSTGCASRVLFNLTIWIHINELSFVSAAAILLCVELFNTIMAHMVFAIKAEDVCPWFHALLANNLHNWTRFLHPLHLALKNRSFNDEESLSEKFYLEIHTKRIVNSLNQSCVLVFTWVHFKEIN